MARLLLCLFVLLNASTANAQSGRLGSIVQDTRAAPPAITMTRTMMTTITIIVTTMILPYWEVFSTRRSAIFFFTV
jgi:hypothetical protein